MYRAHRRLYASPSFARPRRVHKTSRHTTRVRRIEEAAFFGCWALHKIQLPVDAIQRNAFENCTHLQDVRLPAVTTVDKYAFRGCNALRNIHMPQVRILEDNVFQGCPLDKMVLPALQQVENNTFQHNTCPLFAPSTLHVPYTPKYDITRNSTEPTGNSSSGNHTSEPESSRKDSPRESRPRQTKPCTSSTNTASRTTQHYDNSSTH